MKLPKDSTVSRQRFLVLSGGAAAGLAACSGGGGSPQLSTTVTPTSTPTSMPSSKPTSAPTSTSGGTTPTSTPTPTATGTEIVLLSIDRSKYVGALPKRFVGLSYEKKYVTESFFTGSNSALIGCFKTLGPSVIRIGGVSVEEVVWEPNGSGGVYDQVAPSDIEALGAFLQAAGWSVIYSLGLAKNTAANAASEAAYVAAVLGSSLYAFEIGNEPDKYVQDGYRPSTYGVSDYITEWNSYASAIRQSVPNVAISGPDSASSLTTWTVPFAEATHSSLQLLTQHYSRGSGMDATSTIPLLLSFDRYLEYVCQTLSSASISNGVTSGYRLTEVDSFYDGGAPNVSNAYASALWAVDFIMACATYGAAGLNFQTGGNDPGYTPIADLNGSVQEIRAEYYGLLLGSQIASGPMYAVDVTTNLLLTSYCVVGSDGATYLLIVNKEAEAIAATTVSLGAPGTSATQLVLAGAGLASLTGTTLGGSAVFTSGAWSPKNGPTIPVSDSKLQISVAPSTAVLLKIH